MVPTKGSKFTTVHSFAIAFQFVCKHLQNTLMSVSVFLVDLVDYWILNLIYYVPECCQKSLYM